MADVDSSSEHTDAFSRPILPKFVHPEGRLAVPATPVDLAGRNQLSANQPAYFKRYSTHYWTCKVCVRESLQHLYLMTPRMAEQHEENAYHRHNTSQFLYQLKQFSPEPNTAWDGPDPETDTFAWLREKEFREYNERKAAEWAKENPDWNAYDPAKDEFLHPHLDSGWRKKKLRSKVAKNAATRFIPKQQKEEKKEDDGDTVRVVRKGMALGCYAYDPLPKPAKDISLWIKGLKGASTKKEELAPNIDWNQKFATNLEKPEELPLSSKTAKALFDFGMARARRVKMNEKKKEEMFLFLELPTAEKVRRIETLALRLCNPLSWPKVIDETRYWN